jgi:hypothetical protein
VRAVNANLNMDAPEQRELEKFIDQQLKKLPEREAPDELVTNVFAAIAARQDLPWWKQPFTSWPRNPQALLFAALSLVFAAVVYFAWRPAEALGASSLGERASSLAWLGRAVETIANCTLLVARVLPWQWLVAFAVVCVAMYAACVATGFALYRIAGRQGASA